MRCAAYARFSSELQRDTSIDDQLAAVQTYAKAHGWTVLADHVYTDAALSGSSLERPGIQALLAAAARRPLPFDIVLVDDSSRVARDLADAVRVLQQLKFFGVRVIYISQNIDSDNDQAETLIAVHGVVDSLYLREMAKKIKRGLAGQLDRGFATGSSTYGYRTVPMVDPSGKRDASGYPALIGKCVEIEPAEARVIVQIYEWFAEGFGVRRIVERLNRSRTVSARGGHWKHGAVWRILRNEKYVGKLIWGQRRFEREPGTRRKVARPVPRDQWHVQDRPDLRIVDAELWARVQQRHAAIRATLPEPAAGKGTLMRGRNAALFSRHLFSGFLKCAECGGSIVIMHGGNGSPRYGCSRSWRNGPSTCSNRLTVRASLADARLLEGLTSALLQPATVRYITDTLASELNRRLSERPRLESETRTAREQVAQRLQRLVTAIEDGAPAYTLLAAIREREGELQRLDAQLTDLAEPLGERLAVMPTWVRQQVADLAGLLSGTPERAKAEFQRLGLSVTLRAIRDEQARPFYRADGRADLPWLAGTRDLSGAAVVRFLQ